MIFFAETERLLLRKILPTDVEGMYKLDSDAEVHKYLGNEPVAYKEQTVIIIKHIRQQYIDHGIGRWAIIDKQTNEFIGWTGLKFITEKTNNHINYFDLGYRLIKKHWGKGIATEAAFASLQYAFKELNANEIYAIAECENINSNKLLKKVGLKYIEKFDLNGVIHNWYKIDKSEFKSDR